MTTYLCTLDTEVWVSDAGFENKGYLERRPWRFSVRAEDDEEGLELALGRTLGHLRDTGGEIFELKLRINPQPLPWDGESDD